MMQFVGELLRSQFGITVPYVRIIDMIQILLLTVLFYRFIGWMRNTKAWNLFKGLMALLLFYMLAIMLDMSVIVWLVNNFLSVLILAIVIIFHPEIRQALDRLGSSISSGRQGTLLKQLIPIDFGKELNPDAFTEETADALVTAAFAMSMVKTGALIVIQNQDPVEHYVQRWGTSLDAKVSSDLLINIFEKNTPLHDGAVIIVGNRIVAAKCFLPLNENSGISSNLGTRHHAAGGISEVTDSITIIVSEQTGRVSVSQKGSLHSVNKQELKDALSKLYETNEESGTGVGSWIFKGGRKDGEQEIK